MRSPIAKLAGPKTPRKKPLTDVDCLMAAARGLGLRPTKAGDDPPSITWAAQHLRVRDREGAIRYLRANPAQVDFERNRQQRNIILKARQMGVTTWIAGRFFLKTITNPGTLTVMVAQTRESSEAIFQTVQRFWECLHKEDQEGMFQRSIANVSTMRFPALDSEFRVLSASDQNAGRGLTMQNLHCSEVARWPGNASDTLAGLRAALAPGGELVLESTPRGAYGCFYDEWNRAIDPPRYESTRGASDSTGEGSTTLVRHFFPWWMEPAYTAAPVLDFTSEEEQLALQHGLSAHQIGFRRGLEESYHALRSQEFAEDPETCFRATGDCCFDIDSIERRLLEVRLPLESRRGGALHIFLPSQPLGKYIVGVDTAGGGSEGDFCAVEVIDRTTGVQCAELQQRLKPMELARLTVDLAVEYGNALVAVERNNHGGQVLLHIESTFHYPHLYLQSNQQGWLTTAASKPAMVGHMGALLAQSPELFYSRRLLAECRSFVNSEGGKTGAAKGAHDDCFMAMAIAQSVRAEVSAGRTHGVRASSNSA